MAHTQIELPMKFIKDIKQLRIIFGVKSPIPNVAYRELLPASKISLINTKFNIFTFTRIYGNLENFAQDKKGNLTGSKEQTVFIICNSGETFLCDFQDRTIEAVISENSHKFDENEITKIVLLTKYTWHATGSNIIEKQNVSILVFDTC
jgi:hypothetical protein